MLFIMGFLLLLPTEAAMVVIFASCFAAAAMPGASDLFGQCNCGHLGCTTCFIQRWPDTESETQSEASSPDAEFLAEVVETKLS